MGHDREGRLTMTRPSGMVLTVVSLIALIAGAGPFVKAGFLLAAAPATWWVATGCCMESCRVATRTQRRAAFKHPLSTHPAPNRRSGAFPPLPCRTPALYL
jgi:hypothetical protein